jgi:ribulose-phosphate 3-epimerase
MISERGLSTRIEIDGGIDENNIEEVVGAGAEIIVAGTAIFGKEDRAAAIKQLLGAGAMWV